MPAERQTDAPQGTAAAWEAPPETHQKPQPLEPWPRIGGKPPPPQRHQERANRPRSSTTNHPGSSAGRSKEHQQVEGLRGDPAIRSDAGFGGGRASPPGAGITGGQVERARGGEADGRRRCASAGRDRRRARRPLRDEASSRGKVRRPAATILGSGAGFAGRSSGGGEVGGGAREGAVAARLGSPPPPRRAMWGSFPESDVLQGRTKNFIFFAPSDTDSKANLQPPVQVGDEGKTEQPNTTDEPLGDSCSFSGADDSKKVSREDIELVQNLIERCLQLYMNRGEVVRTLSTRARIEPGFTTLVWKKLEEENSEFFQAYYIRLKLKKQINLFNHLLEHQYNLMKYPVPQQVPLAPTQNGMSPMPVNNLPIGYPVLQQPGIPAPGQPHVNAMVCGPPGYHIANGMPYHPIRMSSANGIMDNELPEAAHAATVFGTVSSEIAMSPSSAMSSNHLAFTPSELSEMDVDASAVDTTIGADVANGGPLQIGLDSGDGSSLGQQIWDFSLSDLSADLTNLEDLAALENYAGNPFLPSDSDILLDSPDHDDIVEYVADAVDGPSQSDEEK